MSSDSSIVTRTSAPVDLGLIVIFLMLMLYMFFEAFKHKYHLTFGHEASMITLVGFIISYIVYAVQTESVDLSFDEEMFFYLCIPPIVFSRGFNMHRGKFFDHFSDIMLFGLLGTFITFMTFSGLIILFQHFWPERLHMYDPTTGTSSSIDLSNEDILLMSSLMVSLDVIAAVDLVSIRDNPMLYSVVFGEGVTNDAVCIILFNIVHEFNKEGKAFTYSSSFSILWTFIKQLWYSVMCGVVFGLACSYLLKAYRSFSTNALFETTVIFLFGYSSYIIGEAYEISGHIALLASAITMANYAWFNLSPQGRQTSAIVYQFLGFATEGFLFSYLGLTFFSYADYPWSTGLILL